MNGRLTPRSNRSPPVHVAKKLARMDDRPAILGGTPRRPEGPPGWPPDDPAVSDALRRLASDRSWGRYFGPHVESLRERLSAMHDGAHVVLCASGTAAIELALRGLRVQTGDEIILSSYDFRGNFLNSVAIGGVPVLIDPRPDNWNLDVSRVEAAITPRTRAIVATHLHGGVVDMPALCEIARRRGIAVLEDACQMPGSGIHGRTAGTWGDAGVLSFGGSKLLSAGRGGAVITASADVAQRIRLYAHRENEAYPLSELQAAVVLPQLDRLDRDNALRTERAARLAQRLAQSPGLVAFHNPPSDSRPGYYKVGLQYDAAAFAGLSRDDFACAMRAEGIAISPGFRSLHAIHSPRRYRAPGELAEAARADRASLVLHHPVLLGKESDIDQIIDAAERIRKWAPDIRPTGPGEA